MQTRNLSGSAIVLSRRNFGEADRIIKLYTQKHGKIGVIAKGVRKPQSRKRGHLEIFSHISFQAIGSDLGILTEAVNNNSFEKIRKDLNKVSLAYYFCEVVEKITHDHEENRELFDFLRNFLIRLQTEKRLKSLRREFVTKLLMIMGYWPRDEKIPNPDHALSEVLEREISSVKIGKKMLG